MNLWFRVLRVLVLALLRPKLGLLDESRLDFRVWPTDLDINVHMNNARYLALMDLGRLDLIVRSGMGRRVWRDKLQPVIGAALVRYRRPLAPFQPIRLRSRLLAWDDKWLFIEHRLESGDVLACHAVVKGMLVGNDGGVPPADLARQLGFDQPSPPVPDWVTHWSEAESLLAKA